MAGQWQLLHLAVVNRRTHRASLLFDNLPPRGVLKRFVKSLAEEQRDPADVAAPTDRAPRQPFTLTVPIKTWKPTKSPLHGCAFTHDPEHMFRYIKASRFLSQMSTAEAASDAFIQARLPRLAASPEVQAEMQNNKVPKVLMRQALEQLSSTL